MDNKLKTAKNIKAISEKALNEFIRNGEKIVAEVNNRMESRSDIVYLLGNESNIQIMRDNHNYHLKFVITIFQSPSPQVLVDTISWVFRSYRARGFHPAYWNAQIDCWIEVFKSLLTQETFNEIIPLYDWFNTSIPDFTRESD